MKLGKADATSPEGFQIVNWTSNGADEILTFNESGDSYFGEIGGFNAFADFESKVSAFQTNSAKASVSGGHRTTGSKVFRGYLLENTGSWVHTDTSYVTAQGGSWTRPVAVGSLPTPSSAIAGMRFMVSDSTVAASGNFGATVAGTGSNVVPVFCDGSNWLIG